MEKLRKIDCYGQLILVSLSVLSIPLFYGGSLFIGLFFIGCWQLLSAILNTHSFIHNGFRRRIFYYWGFCIIDLLSLALSISSLKSVPGNDVIIKVLVGITLIGSIATAVYYWCIYYKFIEFLSLRNELDGLTKSKH